MSPIYDFLSIEFPKNGNSWVILSDIEQQIKQNIFRFFLKILSRKAVRVAYKD